MGDATELDLEEGGADVVFSNWLLMYLDDDEVYDLASDALAWVPSLRLSSHPHIIWPASLSARQL